MPGGWRRYVAKITSGTHSPAPVSWRVRIFDAPVHRPGERDQVWSGDKGGLRFCAGRVSTGRQSGRGGVADAGQGEPNIDIQDCGMRVTTKIIKPKKIKSAQMRADLVAAVVATGKEIDAFFLLTYATFDHKPRFVIENKDEENKISAAVYTTDQIYAWINDGTKPHVIRPKKAKMLAFPSAFRPKTSKAVLTSGQGYKSSSRVLALQVEHPGTEARSFDERIEKKAIPNFKKRVAAAMKEAADDSGHAI